MSDIVGLDTVALLAAIEAQRKARKLSMRQVANEANVSPSTLTRLSQGKRPDVDSFAALVAWLGMPADRFLRGRREESADVLAVISTHLRASKELTPRSADALEDIIRAAYQHLKTKAEG